MASAVQQYLAYFAHPVYPRRAVIINAVDLPTAQAVAAAQCTGDWTVQSVTLFVPPTGS